MRIVKEIRGNSIKDYVKAFRSCKLLNGCLLEPKFGSVSLDFSGHPTVDHCIITAKKVSGNGKLTISCDGQLYHFVCASKKGQDFEFKLPSNKQFKIIRDNVSTGIIFVSAINLATSSSNNKSAPVSLINWHDILSNVQHKNINLVDNRLFATNGSCLFPAKKLKGVTSSPPNAFKIVNDYYLFTEDCEIISINFHDSKNRKVEAAYLNSNFNAPPKSSTILEQAQNIQMKQSAPIATPPPVPIPVSDKPPEIKKEIIPTNIVNAPSQVSSTVIYDTSTIDPNNLRLASTGKNTIIKGRSIILQKNASFSLNLMNLQPNTEYVVALMVEGTSGNGKILIRMLTSQNDFRSQAEVIANKKNPTISTKIYTGAPSIDGIYKLELLRPPNSSGDVWLQKIVVMQGITIPNNHPLVTHSKDYTFFRENNSKPQIKVPISTSSISIMKLSKKFATLAPEEYPDGERFNHKGIIQPIGFNANVWANKILPMVPKVKFNSNLLDKNTTKDEPDVLICNIEDIKPCKRIWIQEFIDKSLTEKQIKILKQSDKLFSPSLPNVQYMSRILNKKVIYLPKVWPYVTVQPHPVYQSNYMLLFNRDDRFTRNFISVFDYKSMPTLVVVGARGRYPSYIKLLTDYVPYPQLLFLIKNSKCIIDLVPNNHYMSGLQDLAMISKVPLVTNNHWMSIAKPAADFVPSYFINGEIFPALDNINNLIKSAISKKKAPFGSHSYNLNLKAILNHLLL